MRRIRIKDELGTYLVNLRDIRYWGVGPDGKVFIQFRWSGKHPILEPSYSELQFIFRYVEEEEIEDGLGGFPNGEDSLPTRSSLR